jgi:hypothetical protein
VPFCGAFLWWLFVVEAFGVRAIFSPKESVAEQKQREKEKGSEGCQSLLVGAGAS